MGKEEQGTICLLDNLIETHMWETSGDFLKVYLYLFQCKENGRIPSLGYLEERLGCTQEDVERALQYWEDKQLLSIERNADRKIISLSLTDAPSAMQTAENVSVPEEKNYSPAQTEAFKEQEWYGTGNRTVEEAMAHSKPFARECIKVLGVFGLNNREPLAMEITYVKRWMNKYGFSMDMILEACRKTMERIHKPRFEYADALLKRWKDLDIRSLSDVEKMEKEIRAHKEAEERKQRAMAYESEIENKCCRNPVRFS